MKCEKMKLALVFDSIFGEIFEVLCMAIEIELLWEYKDGVARSEEIILCGNEEKIECVCVCVR